MSRETGGHIRLSFFVTTALAQQSLLLSSEFSESK